MRAGLSRPTIWSSNLSEIISISRGPSSEPHRPTTSRPMTPKEAAAFLGLDVKTITRWARQGYLPAHPMGQGKKKYWRFFEHELITWLLGHSEQAVAA